MVDQISIDLPGIAPDLNSSLVNFSSSSGFQDADATCNGTASAPSAPPGKLCIYPYSVSNDIDRLNTAAYTGRLDTSFNVIVSPSTTGSAGDDMILLFTWAYMAP